MNARVKRDEGHPAVEGAGGMSRGAMGRDGVSSGEAASGAMDRRGAVPGEVVDAEAGRHGMEGGEVAGPEAGRHGMKGGEVAGPEAGRRGMERGEVAGPEAGRHGMERGEVAGSEAGRHGMEHGEVGRAEAGRRGMEPGEADRDAADRRVLHHSDRVAALDWSKLSGELDNQGSALVERLLEPEECRSLAALYPQDSRFRSRVVMSRHGFGRGEYKYFSYPLPDTVNQLRTDLYPRLAPIANRWNESLVIAVRYPPQHAEFLARCAKAGQTRPTPLLLQYEAGDYNCLHQDLYGEHVFPLQVAILLSEPEKDFTGGEFVITEQRPRMQSRPEVVPLRQGDAVIFAVHHRPVKGTRGMYRVNLRHGVSRVRSGHRHTLGIIFHDAK